MLLIDNQSHFDKVKAFAETNSLTDAFNDRLDYLRNYGCSEEKPDRGRVRLGYDFAPNSFGIEIEFKQADGSYAHFMTGAMVFDPGTSTWGVHT